MTILHFFLPALFTLAVCPVLGEHVFLTDAVQRQVTFPTRPL